MFSDSNEYDFEKQENAAKWKGVFISSLRKVSPRTMLVTLSNNFTKKMCGILPFENHTIYTKSAPFYII